MPTHKGTKQIAANRKAFHDYFIEERYEAGIELCGTEVKSVRAGKVNLKDSFCQVKNGELMVYAMHISPYEKGNIFNREPMRDRRLLMHKREILRIQQRLQQDGYALIPLSLYLKDSRAKVELGLAKGKKLYDKRASEAERSAKREMDRVMKSHGRY
ncbi:MAG: SsrA-binding protein SmpB [Clostridiales bacterium]|nr:SsrA-binding protein SmpB [Clostridiales bacterium]